MWVNDKSEIVEWDNPEKVQSTNISEQTSQTTRDNSESVERVLENESPDRACTNFLQGAEKLIGNVQARGCTWGWNIIMVFSEKISEEEERGMNDNTVELEGKLKMEPTLNRSFNSSKKAFGFKLVHEDYYNVTICEDLIPKIRKHLDKSDLSLFKLLLKKYEEEMTPRFIEEIESYKRQIKIIEEKDDEDKSKKLLDIEYYKKLIKQLEEELKVLKMVKNSKLENIKCELIQSWHSQYFSITPFTSIEEKIIKVKRKLSKLRGEKDS